MNFLKLFSEISELVDGEPVPWSPEGKPHGEGGKSSDGSHGGAPLQHKRHHIRRRPKTSRPTDPISKFRDIYRRIQRNQSPFFTGINTDTASDSGFASPLPQSERFVVRQKIEVEKQRKRSGFTLPPELLNLPAGGCGRRW